MSDGSFQHRKYLAPTYPFRGKTFVKGEGAYLFDQQGKKYLDLVTNYGVNIFGHSHPAIVKALNKQLQKLTNLHSSFANPERNLAAKLLVSRCGGQSAKVYWANSGTEAVEAALKFAMAVTHKLHFVAAQGGYHGKTLGSLAVTHAEKYRGPFNQVLIKTRHVPYGKITALAEVLNSRPAAVILEPTQAETGIKIPPRGYLKAVAKLCANKGVLLIVDEIQSGIGRTGWFLACHEEEVAADIICLGKGLAGGLPVGATVVSAAVAAKLTTGLHTCTFGGNPLAAAGVIAVLKLLTQKRLESNRRLGQYFLEKLQAIKSRRIAKVVGKGLWVGVELKDRCTPVLKAMQEQGILAAPAGDFMVRFLPPYIVTKAQINSAVKTLKKCLA